MEFFDHSKEGLIAAVEPDKELEIKEKERLLHHIQVINKNFILLTINKYIF